MDWVITDLHALFEVVPRKGYLSKHLTKFRDSKPVGSPNVPVEVPPLHVITNKLALLFRYECMYRCLIGLLKVRSALASNFS